MIIMSSEIIMSSVVPFILGMQVLNKEINVYISILTLPTIVRSYKGFSHTNWMWYTSLIVYTQV